MVLSDTLTDYQKEFYDLVIYYYNKSRSEEYWDVSFETICDIFNINNIRNEIKHHRGYKIFNTIMSTRNYGRRDTGHRKYENPIENSDLIDLLGDLNNYTDTLSYITMLIDSYNNTSYDSNTRETRIFQLQFHFTLIFEKWNLDFGSYTNNIDAYNNVISTLKQGDFLNKSPKYISGDSVSILTIISTYSVTMSDSIYLAMITFVIDENSGNNDNNTGGDGGGDGGDTGNPVSVIDIIKHRNKIPDAIRRQVWDNHIPDNPKKGECYLCKSKIFYKGFLCGYLVAPYNGGTFTVSNLRPIDGFCALILGGTKDMVTYATEYNFDIPERHVNNPSTLEDIRQKTVKIMMKNLSSAKKI